ncbi:porin [Fluviicola taffensis]|uniref:Phosphate-selective porin O and P n=1 Tax=Fluviicola taffensis (strain DSM 16823 / NCIMB 13979 / RW262) TaxID=755732 RepID=F2IBK4_FLUTR|nr:porin [Fluviicola taffensis]AEA44312.1 phosphate-selective porin O and P [Fluviicola taffensis DSM 16823]
MKNILIFSTLLASNWVFAQKKIDLSILTKPQRGIEFIGKDSLFSLRLQFRMQNRAAMLTRSDTDLSAETYEFRVRRVRLKMEGFVYSPKLTYKLQLAFSRGDMDWDMTQMSQVNTSVNIVRDAVISYEPWKNVKFSFGQTKLPGNRQRVISSGDQQFADRSIVNATFTIDRDFGFFGAYKHKYFAILGSLTSGEGRNSSQSNSGLSYTGRVEVLPFGSFTDKNDYQEGDLEREQKPKLSIGASYNFNDDAVRAGGQLGRDLFVKTDMSTLSLDLLFKYKGFALYTEFMQRNCSNPITYTSDSLSLQPVYAGNGFLQQVSYCFKSNWEIALRYAEITPFSSIYNNSAFPSINLKKHQEFQLGVTKYIYGHRVKVQGNILYQLVDDLKARTNAGKFGAIFQIELGI